ncbi:MAG: outer membrane beta-barrel protein [Thiolinea sp.]
MKKLILIGLSLLAVHAGSVLAYDYTYTEDAEVRNGFENIYAGASIGLSGGDIGSECDKQDMNCTSWKAFAGYRTSEHWAFEGGYHNLLSDRSSSSTQRNDVTALSLSVLGIMALDDFNIDAIPYSDQLEVFGKLGMAAWNSESDFLRYNDGTDFLLGGGAQMKLNENVGVRGEMEYIGGDVDSTNYSAGLTYSTF